MSAEREIAAEDSIRVVCRFRPLNDSEEKAGSKVIVKFPNTQEENCISIGVSILAKWQHLNGNGSPICHPMVSSIVCALNVYGCVSIRVFCYFNFYFMIISIHCAYLTPLYSWPVANIA